jgi:5S rRNA maturation endonuclease (ribonuclease M5)
MNEVEQYVADKGWTVKARERIGGKMNFVLDCPLCGAVTNMAKKKRRFYLCLENTKFVCNDCGKKGNLYTLKKELGDVVAIESNGWIDDLNVTQALVHPPQPTAMEQLEGHLDKFTENLLNDSEAMEWMTGHAPGQRALDVETIKRFRLGIRENRGKKWLVIPYFADGKLIRCKYRTASAHEKDFRMTKDCPSVLFNVDDLDGEFQRVYITEGELDTIALCQMGFYPVVSLPNGAKNIAEHSAWLENFDSVYVVTDMDSAGMESAKEIARQIGAFRCMRVNLPAKDANDCLRMGFTERVRSSIASASNMGGGSIMHLADLFEEAISPSGQALSRGWDTGIGDLTMTIGGFRRSEWCWVSGPSGAGKSALIDTFKTNILLAKQSVFAGSFELHPHAHAVRWVSQIVGKSVHNMTNAEKQDAIGKLRGLGSQPIVVPRQGYMPMKEYFGMFEYAARRYGCSACSFDHLDFALKDINSLTEIDGSVLAFNNGVAKLNAFGILGVHPTKPPQNRKGERRKLTCDDIRGSGKIHQLSHWGGMLRKWNEDGISIFSVEKIRWEGVSKDKLPIPVPLKFNKKALRYEDAPAQNEFDAKVAAAGGNDW